MAEPTEETGWRRWWNRIRGGVAGIRDFFRDLPGTLQELRRSWRDVYPVSATARETARNPNATGDELERALQTLLDADESPLFHAWNTVETLVAHPNLPPDSLVRLINTFPVSAASAIPDNPVFPLITLERPDLPGEIIPSAARTILRSYFISEPMAQFLTLHPDPLIAWEAETSVVLAGEIEPGTDWRSALDADVRRLFSICPHDLIQMDMMATVGMSPREILPTLDPFFEDEKERREQAEVLLAASNISPPLVKNLTYHKDHAGRVLWYLAILPDPIDECEDEDFDWQAFEDARVIHPQTPSTTLAATLVNDPVQFRWVWTHPNMNDAGRTNWKAWLISRAMSRGGPFAPYFALTTLPSNFWHSLPRLNGDLNWPSVPDPWAICRLEDFGPMERAAAIPHLPDLGRFDRRRYLIDRLLNDNNRYVRAAARERFGREAATGGV